MKTTMLIVSTIALAQSVFAQTDFSDHWHDGRAELDGYKWSVTRYGETREGQAVAIYVTEPFSDAKRVKVDYPDRNPADTFDALKLNLVRDFQTGIYDYNTMTSVFVHSDDFSPAKVSFTSAEWCGHVYEELIFKSGSVQEQFFSYFENESSSKTLDPMPRGVAEDNLFILLRGLRGAYLAPGESTSVPFLPGAFYRRLVHRPIEWTTADIERLAAMQTVTVPAGEFQTIVYVVRVEGGREGRFDVERDYPHRIVRWRWHATAGGRRAQEAAESGELTGTTRVKYWSLNGNGDERFLDELGLPTAPPQK